MERYVTTTYRLHEIHMFARWIGFFQVQSPDVRMKAATRQFASQSWQHIFLTEAMEKTLWSMKPSR